MGIHDLTPENKAQQRENHLRLDFPFAYGISLGEFPCIHRCRMCPMYSMPVTTPRFITRTIFERACNCLGERKSNLEISAYGETFQHPEADAFLAHARKLCPNAEIVVATNGALLHEERCKRIVDSGIDHLSFSLDAGSPESHNWLTGASNYDLICRNLHNLVAIRDKRGAKHLKITTHIIGIKELQHEFDGFLERWSQVADFAYIRNYGNWAGLVDNNGVSPTEKQFIPEDRYPCTWLWYATKVEPNGDVSKCFIHVTGDKNPLGNIMQQDYVDIWKGERMQRLRRMHQTNRYCEIEHCPYCNVWSLFPHFWEKNSNGDWK